MFRPAAQPGLHGARRPLPRLLLPAAAFIACVLLLLSGRAGANHSASPHAVAISAGPASGAAAAAAAGAYKVPVTLYVMSQCPDARFCQAAFYPVLKALPNLLTIKTEYIAKLGKEEDGVTCPHGTRECEGNKQQLCLQHNLPAADNGKFFTALMCHSNGDVGNVQHLQTCMGEAGIASDVQAKVLQCASGTQATTLQVASAKDVKANEVVRSCTVFIAGTKRCVRDGGRWYDCPGGSDTQAFIKQACEAYAAKVGKAAAECAAAMGQAGTPQ